MVRGLMVSTCAFHSAGDRFRDGADRSDDLTAGRRADRLAVERDGKAAIGRRDAGLLVEPLAPWRARGASTASSGSKGECPATSSKSSRISCSASAAAINSGPTIR
jgi:hypothetical protein